MQEDKSYLKAKMTITPALAKEWLEHNEFNRTISKTRLELYAKQMKDGEWQYNHESIKIYEDGSLMDGQHRLKACILADTPFISDVWLDIPCEGETKVDIVDVGQSRNPSQSFMFRNHTSPKYSRFVTMVANTFYNVEKNIIIVPPKSIDEFSEVYNKDLEIVYDLCFKGDNKKKAICVNTKSAAFVFSMLCALRNGVKENVAARFIEIFRTGRYENSKELAPIVLREDYLERNLVHAGNSTIRQNVMAIQKAIWFFNSGLTRSKTFTITKDYSYKLSSDYEQLLKYKIYKEAL